MFVSKVLIKNYRLFDSEVETTIDGFNVPDDKNEGSGLTILVGENGSGKTTILDAFATSILEYKADTFDISDMNDPNKLTEISIFSEKPFQVKGTYPNTDFYSLGFYFKANQRSKGSKSYLSTLIVSDQLFIKEDPNKPKDNSPDLRTRVNNPFSGKRFNDTDVVYLDKNRLFQTRHGTYNATRFDRIMGDFNFQYNKNSDIKEDLNKPLNDIAKKGKIENEQLAQAIKHFEEISNYKVQLDFIDNYNPFNNASFVVKKGNNQQISLSNLGSGYEMVFSLIYSYHMSIQNNKKLIILIDEPELHLHPKIQEKFVDFFLKMSKHSQIIVTTHSPLLVKQLSYNSNIKTIIVNNDKTFSTMADRKLNYISSNETNYLAYNLATEEYHNELYEELKSKHGDDFDIKKFDTEFFIKTKNEKKKYKWKGNDNEVSLHTYVRNQIHHRSDNGIASYSDLQKSIEIMRGYL